MVYVIVIFTLKKFHVLVVLQNLGQNHEVKDNGWNCDVLWGFSLEVTVHGTWV